MSKTKITYLAGKVTGIEYGEAVQKFCAYEEQLKKEGYIVVNPMKICEKHDDWKVAMQKCIEQLIYCESIHLMPDWVDSKGSQLEHTISQQLGISINFLQ